MLLVTGQDKAEAVAKLLRDDPELRGNLPAAQINSEGSFIVVLDAVAAKQARSMTP